MVSNMSCWARHISFVNPSSSCGSLDKLKCKLFKQNIRWRCDFMLASRKKWSGRSQVKCQERGIPFGTLVKVPCDFGCLVEIEYGPGIFGWAQELLLEILAVMSHTWCSHTVLNRALGVMTQYRICTYSVCTEEPIAAFTPVSSEILS